MEELIDQLSGYEYAEINGKKYLVPKDVNRYLKFEFERAITEVKNNNKERHSNLVIQVRSLEKKIKELKKGKPEPEPAQLSAGLPEKREYESYLVVETEHLFHMKAYYELFSTYLTELSRDHRAATGCCL
jgi:hypothetical protein